MQAPVALVTLVDVERQWFKSCIGLDETETATEISFCAHAIAAGDEPMVVTDATIDPRFSGNPLVTGKHHIRFYAGAPMVVAGARIGTLCVLDQKPHAFRLRRARAIEVAGRAWPSSLFALKDATRSGALAEAALAREEKRRAIALDAASLASWAWDIRPDMIECDVRLSELFNLPRANRLRARDILAAIDPRDVYQTETRFRDALTGSDDYLRRISCQGLQSAAMDSHARPCHRARRRRQADTDLRRQLRHHRTQARRRAATAVAARTEPSRQEHAGDGAGAGVADRFAMHASQANSSKPSAPGCRRWALPTTSCPTASGAASAFASSCRSR